MILIKGGGFRMGDDGQWSAHNAAPSHMVKVATFRIDVTEVTVAAYRSCVRAGACSEPRAHASWYGCTWAGEDRDQHPVNCVTWAQADAYCKWAGKELPTEEQWEFAARGRAGREFPWGMGVRNRPWGLPEDEKAYLQGCNLDGSMTCPVGSAPRGATPEGVLDLAGNVVEWTSSKYCEYSEPSCNSGFKVVRGGASRDGPRERFAARRVGVDPTRFEDRWGFRCAQRVEEGK